MRPLFIIVLLACSSVAMVSHWQSVRADQPPGFSLSLDQLKWTKMTDGTGRETVTVFGDRTKHELFGYAVRWQPNTTAKAHSHPDTRYVVVLSGTFYHGQGRTFDATKLERHSTGTFFSEPAGIAHFGATKGDAAVLYFVGIGPDRTDVVEK
jgi:quercetin dioxygenase-like cupin family protein